MDGNDMASLTQVLRITFFFLACFKKFKLFDSGQLSIHVTNRNQQPFERWKGLMQKKKKKKKKNLISDLHIPGHTLTCMKLGGTRAERRRRAGARTSSLRVLTSETLSEDVWKRGKKRKGNRIQRRGPSPVHAQSHQSKVVKLSLMAALFFFLNRFSHRAPDVIKAQHCGGFFFFVNN